MSGILMVGGQLLLSSGSAATPSLAFTSDSTFGIYLGSGLSIAYSGTLGMDFPGSGVAMRTIHVFGSQSNPFSTIGDSSHRFIEVWASNGIINTSHSDFKLEIKSIDYKEVPQGVTYRWKDKPDRPYAGFLADNLPKEAFLWNADGSIDKKAVEHTAIVGILCDATRKLQKQVEDLEARIVSVKKQKGSL